MLNDINVVDVYQMSFLESGNDKKWHETERFSCDLYFVFPFIPVYCFLFLHPRTSITKAFAIKCYSWSSRHI